MIKSVLYIILEQNRDGQSVALAGFKIGLDNTHTEFVYHKYIWFGYLNYTTWTLLIIQIWFWVASLLKAGSTYQRKRQILKYKNVVSEWRNNEGK